ncbi:UDP-N-acetylglucosamine--N-acetylmuramyl-(pentapeptide) pyrophosphoryl-undecaprenol N-acetylglucosamine transferase [Candidatus Entotheonellaceae bacterium PAL068K]
MPGDHHSLSDQPLRLVFTGGGSGGPTTPLLAVYRELNKQLGPDRVGSVFWGTADGPEKAMVQQVGMPFQAIPSGKLRRYWSWQNVLDPLFVLLGFGVGLIKLIQFKPHVVVSAGSFVSVPVAYAAWLLRIPHLILQMDVHPGLANRLMAPVSQALAYVFEQTACHFPSITQQKIGPVVRPEIAGGSAAKANAQFHLTPHKSVLLVTGGGQGALGINRAVERVLPFWLERFQVVHLTGKSHPGADLRHRDYHAIPFVSDGMGDLLTRSDLVVTRAGLGILGELAYLAKDAVLVPLPNSHQERNARAVVEAEAGVLLNQDQFLQQGITWWKGFLHDYKPGQLGQNLHQLLPPGGTQAFATLILRYR